MDSISFILTESINFGSETILKITLQPLKAKHLRGLSDKPGMSELLDLVGKASGQPKPVIDELSAADALSLMEIVGGFLTRSRETGSSASA